MNSEKQRPASAVRLINRDGRVQVERLGFKRHPLSDFFHMILKAKWRVVVAIVLFIFLLLNCGFAWLYGLIPNSIENARPDSFVDAFFFSVQTMATIGYGYMHPKGIFANFLATLEALLGLLGFALASALMFAKFSRPTAKIVFSENALISVRDKKPILIFRLANERNNQIIEASMNLTMMRTEVTLEGERLRTFHDLKLLRSRTPVFALTWQVVHVIDEQSPLYGLDKDSLAALEPEFVITFSGVDDTYSQNVYVRHSYLFDEVLWGRRFEDIFSRNEQGVGLIDFRKFHQSRELESK